MRVTSFLMVASALALLAGACKPAPEAAETATTEPEVAPAAAPAAMDAAPTDVLPQQGERYWVVRQRLEQAGFTAVDVNDEEFTVCPDAMEQQREIAVTDCPSQVMVLPEVEACAGTGMGNCRINWRSPDGRFLTIFTVDDPQPGVIDSIQWSNTRPAYEQ